MLVRVHSGWSLGCGVVRVAEALEWARRWAVPAICLADFDNLYGAIEFYEQARQAGIKPIPGAVITQPVVEGTVEGWGTKTRFALGWGCPTCEAAEGSAGNKTRGRGGSLSGQGVIRGGKRGAQEDVTRRTRAGKSPECEHRLAPASKVNRDGEDGPFETRPAGVSEAGLLTSKSDTADAAGICTSQSPPRTNAGDQIVNGFRSKHSDTQPSGARVANLKAARSVSENDDFCFSGTDKQSTRNRPGNPANGKVSSRENGLSSWDIFSCPATGGQVDHVAETTAADAAEVDGPFAAATKIVVSRLDVPRVVAIACSRTGYENLCKILTRRHLDGRFNLVGMLAEYQEGLVFLIDDPDLLRQLANVIEPGRLYAEIYDYGDGTSRSRNCRLLRVAEQLKIEPIATHPAYFARPADWHVHKVLRAIATNDLVGRLEPSQIAPRGAWLQPADILVRRLEQCGKALENARRLIEACELDLELGMPHFPKANLPAGQNACEALRELSFAGLRARYGNPSREAISRLERELQVICKLGFADYFLVVREIVQYARSRGIWCAGRGSAADSLVTYCLGISSVDPIRYRLNFERFLNESRTDWPDIDLDVDWRWRDEVIRFIYRRWGSDRVAMIATHHFYKARSAFRDVARALGMPLEIVNRLAAKIPYDDPDRLGFLIEHMPECRDFPLGDPQVARAIRLAQRLAGLPRGLSIHIGGVVIADRELTCYTPLQPTAKGIVISQYDKDAIERVGLIKIDILAHRSPAILADAVRLIRQHEDVEIDLDTVPEDDPATAELLRSGRTIGCFQIESPGMRQLLQMLQAKDMTDVIHGLALIRPGPSASGMKDAFVRRKRGLERPTYLHPAMKEILEDTYGVMLFQEDVMRVAAAVAGFSMATGDELRKVLQKPDARQRLADLKEQFMAGALRRGCSPHVAERIWSMVSNFAAYSYNKAHACTYGRIGYLCAYLKAHWPVEFMTAVLNNIGGYYGLSEYLEEARRMGILILPAHVNHSDLQFTVEPVPVQKAVAHRIGANSNRRGDREGNEPVATTDGHSQIALRRLAVRAGLMQVKNLSLSAAGRILQQRRIRPFANIIDLLERTGISVEEARSLIQAGTCDGLGPSRPAMLWQLAMWRNHRARSRRATDSHQRLLFEEYDLTPPAQHSLTRCHLSPQRPAEPEPARSARPTCHEDQEHTAFQTSPGPFLRAHFQLLEISHITATGRKIHKPSRHSPIEPADRCPHAEPAEPRPHTEPPNLQGHAKRHDRSCKNFNPLGLSLPDHILTEYDRSKLIRLERQYLGLSPSDHPLSCMQAIVSKYNAVRSVDLPQMAGKMVTVVGMMVAERRAVTSDGRLMLFVTLEDLWGLVEAVLFPDAYQRLGSIFQSPGPYIIHGHVQHHLDSINLLCYSAQLLHDAILLASSKATLANPGSALRYIRHVRPTPLMPPNVLPHGSQPAQNADRPDRK